MKTFISSFCLLILAATQSLASDCSQQAYAAAEGMPDQSDFYLVRPFSSNVDPNGDYTVVFSCVGETGSHSLSYLVHFANAGLCTSPTTTALGDL